MTAFAGRIVLGSRSPQRRELLALIIPSERIVVVPPTTADEAGFEGLETWSAIEGRLQEIARVKNDDVRAQWLQGPGELQPLQKTAILTADTTIVGQPADGRLAVLGQPPDDDEWPATVRHWFHAYYFGRTHTALTAVCLTTLAGVRRERLSRSWVTFCPADEPRLEWYLQTGEPRGKAGGYAVQGAGSVFVERVEGSLSNVIGLPLREVQDLLREVDDTAVRI